MMILEQYGVDGQWAVMAFLSYNENEGEKNPCGRAGGIGMKPILR